jgi:hypothetical protein
VGARASAPAARQDLRAEPLSSRNDDFAYKDPPRDRVRRSWPITPAATGASNSTGAWRVSANGRAPSRATARRAGDSRPMARDDLARSRSDRARSLYQSSRCMSSPACAAARN